MEFLVLRPLTHSELGMFHAYRRAGREGSRQRAVNFDGDVVDRIFPTATDEDQIDLTLRYETDEGPVELPHHLTRQGKNWRLEGNCPRDEFYAFVEPGCLFAMQINAGVRPATGAWVVLPKDDPAAKLVLGDGATSGLYKAGMIALEPEESARVLRLLATARPDMFHALEPEAMTMTNATIPTQSALAAPAAGRSLPPHPGRLAEILGAAGHSFVSAVADLIDNSINARATEIDIRFDPPDSGHGRWLVIRDNGDGMSQTKLDEAMRVGSETTYDSKSLGKYGYGLKGASWSQARAFKVITRERSQPVLHAGWDKAQMTDWVIDESPLEGWETDATDVGEHGTAVLWKNMKAPTAAPAAKGVSPHVAEIQELSRHLGLVFHRFIEGDARGRPPLIIRINGAAVVANGPASHPLAKPYASRPIKVPVEGGSGEVRVQPYLLPHEDELEQHHAGEGAAAIREAKDRVGYWGRRNESQGLFFYRNDRLIRWGGWHDIWTSDEKSKLARVVIDFDPILDEAFQVNISKQTVRLPGFLKDEIKKLSSEARNDSRAKFYTKKPAKPGPSGSGAGTSGGTGGAQPGVGSSNPADSGAGGLTGTAPGSPGQTSGENGGSPSTPKNPTASPVTVYRVTTKKFAWQITGNLLGGGRSLQVGDASPALSALAEALKNDPERTVLLAKFLEELDKHDLQKAFVATPETA
jgi:hypothetical protein